MMTENRENISENLPWAGIDEQSKTNIAYPAVREEWPRLLDKWLFQERDHMNTSSNHCKTAAEEGQKIGLCLSIAGS